MIAVKTMLPGFVNEDDKRECYKMISGLIKMDMTLFNDFFFFFQYVAGLIDINRNLKTCFILYMVTRNTLFIRKYKVFW